MADGAPPMYTVDGALASIGFGKYQYWLLAYAGMGWISEGMEMMLLSYVGPAVTSLWNLSYDQESLITTVVFLGMLVGCCSWGNISDRYGRRKGFIVTTGLIFLAGLFTSIAPNYVTLLILRCLVGVGLGGGPVLFSWFLEFVPVTGRGYWMVVFSAFWSVGSIVEGGLAWLVMPRIGWRWLLGLSALPSSILLIFYGMTPESPRYLCLQGRKAEAVAILEKIAKANGSQLPPGELVSDNELDANGKVIPGDCPGVTQNNPSGVSKTSAQIHPSVFKLFSSELRKITCLMWITMFGNAFLYYGMVLLTTGIIGNKNHCRIGDNSPSATSVIDFKSSFITACAEFPGLMISLVLIERIGRKRSIALLLFLCSIFLIPLLFNIPGQVATALLFGIRTCISASFALLYIYAPEVYPTNIRSRGFGFGSGMARLGGAVTPYVAVSMINYCRIMLALAIFIAVSFISSLAMLFFPFDTTGRELMDQEVKKPSIEDVSPV